MMTQTDARKATLKRYRERHKERLLARKRAYYERHKESELARTRAWKAANPEKWQAVSRASDARPERRAAKAEAERAPERKATRKAWRLANTEKSAEYWRQWESDHRAERRARHHERKSEPQYRLRRALRARLKQAIKNNFKTGSAVSLLGCSVDELKSQLERQWLPGMTWDNFGRLHAANGPAHWQIDHIRPMQSFDLTDIEQVKVVCHYSNLQPLWALDNRKKWSKSPE
jgi:hypothetical protein